MTPEEIKGIYGELITERDRLATKMACCQFGFEYPWKPHSLEMIKKNNPTDFDRLMRYRGLKEKIATLRDDYLAQTGRELK